VNANEDMESGAATDRLLEESWTSRSRRLPRRELLTELAAAALFCAAVAGLVLVSGRGAGFPVGTALILLGVYVVLAGIEFPVGGGNVVPTQLVLVPMFVLLPPAVVPAAVAAGLLAAKLIDRIRGRGSIERVLFAVPDAWHAIGPAAVLTFAGAPRLDLGDVPLLFAAFAACCVFDAGAAMLREAASRGIAPSLQLQVLALVWMVDACLAPVGFLAGELARRSVVAVLLVLPLAALLLLMARDRHRRIEQAQRRLELVVHERERLQSAVRHMGDAFAARLDLDALLDIVLRGSIHALDADAGSVRLEGRPPHVLGHDERLGCALGAAADAACASGRPEVVQEAAGWVLAVPFAVDSQLAGAVAVARTARPFQPDELALLGELVEKAQTAAAEILGHQALREQAMRDPLTGLGNRRKMQAMLGSRLATVEDRRPQLLMLLDLNGFKAYNDTFGHVAGDALLARLGAKLAAQVGTSGEAYRLGGDEFCAVLDAESERLEQTIASTAQALSESGEEFSISASYGVVLLPHEADGLERALQLADERMYAHKRRRGSAAGQQARDVLMRTMHAKEPSLSRHSDEVAQLAAAVARRLGMNAEAVDEVTRAAELHDIGKVGIPDAILNKPGPLDAAEWDFMREHTILGERILSGAAALRPVARIVRSTHERWDGTGYPDGLAGSDIPRGARIVAVCDAYEAMTSDRAYRRALPRSAACAELRAMAGTQFDPEVVAAFVGEIERLADSDAAGVEVDPPVSAVAEHVRTLLTPSSDQRVEGDVHVGFGVVDVERGA
jgi:diguanylate cyclase (GGDEF)-like protein/putative nucleotidyltransferase with HDIG domain